ncbi:flagellar assembly protein FliH [Bacillus songklensis]|uniref:Flagellar assembly protein FliH n=1 Tax=Bacillus songklensis TaxID=1069116 RepID=A0ABV8AY33_9BACI
MSSIIKSQYTKDHVVQKKTIQIKHFASAGSVEREEQTVEEQQTHPEQIIQEALAKAESIKQQAQSMLQQARSQLDADKQQWEEEKQKMAQDAKRKGYDEGLRLGKQEGMQAYRALLAEAKEMIDQTKRDYHSYIQSSEEVILNLGFEIAEKIIGQQLEQDREKFLPLVKTAIKEVREHREIHLFVSTCYYSVVHEKKEELLSLLNGEMNLFIYPDEELSEMACIIESSFGRIDASVDSQLAEIKKQLLELLKEESGHEG